MDLLYDLVFVVTLSKLGSAFATLMNSPEGSGQATLNLFQLFIPVYFHWLQVSLHHPNFFMFTAVYNVSFVFGTR